MTTEINTNVLELIHSTDKNILHKMENKEWQSLFEILKTMISPSNEKRLSRKCGSVRIVNRFWSLTDHEYVGDTQDSYYVKFINDVLACIRGKNGKKYLKQICLHIYQVAELLRFEPELKTKLVQDEGKAHIEVWLDRY